MKNLLDRMVASALLVAFFPAQGPPPERQVEHHVITSLRDPAVKIHLPESVAYVGADRWTLYDIADCELHAFVDSDSSRNVEKLYWVQFEGYIPARPDLHHTYDSPRHVTLGGMNFYVDTWVRGAGEKTRSGSDFEHLVALLRRQGFQPPEEMMYVRLVHLLDEQKRKELMIIYAERIPSGLTATEPKPGGAASDRWPSLEPGLLERAEKSIRIEALNADPGNSRP